MLSHLFLLDFGKVHLDSPPPYYDDEQMMSNAFAEWRERFGEDWSAVANLLRVLKSEYGIYYVDPRPSDIDPGRADDNNDWMKDIHSEREEDDS